MDSENNNSSSVQQTGEVIRPVVADGIVEEVLKRKYGMTVTEVKELNSYDDRNYFVRVHGDHSSPSIKHVHETGYVLKIINSKFSRIPKCTEAQHEFMACLLKHGINTQEVVPNVDGKYFSLESVNPEIPNKYLVELRTFIPGKIIQDVPYTPDLLIKVGELVGNMTNALKDFDNSYYKNADHLWFLTSVPLIKNYSFCLNNEDKKKVVQEILEAFDSQVVAKYHLLRRGYIHGDPNEQNILVRTDPASKETNIAGILDFTDVSYSYSVMEIAINIAYMMLDSQVVADVDAPGYILAGYLRVRSLTEVEWEVLVPLVAARLAQSLTLGAHANYLEPENTYVLTTSARGWTVLFKFWAESQSSLISRWKTIISSIQSGR